METPLKATDKDLRFDSISLLKHYLLAANIDFVKYFDSYTKGTQLILREKFIGLLEKLSIDINDKLIMEKVDMSIEGENCDYMKFWGLLEKHDDS